MVNLQKLRVDNLFTNHLRILRIASVVVLPIIIYFLIDRFLLEEINRYELIS